MNDMVNDTSLASSVPVPALQPTVEVAAAGTGKAQSAERIISTSAPHASNAADVDGLDETAKVALSGWWSEQCQNVGVEWKKNQDDGDTLLRQTIAMLSLEVALFPNTDWDARLTAVSIVPAKIRSKHKLAKAVAATFILDPTVTDTETARRAGKRIDKWALSVEWLSDQILAMSPAERKDITFDDKGIQKLVDRLMKVGGITRASDTQRSVSNGTGRIVIDRFAGTSTLIEKGKVTLQKREGLANGGVVPVSVSVTVGNGKTPFRLSPHLVEAIKNEVFEAAYEVNPVVNLLGELAQVGMLFEFKKPTKSASTVDASMEGCQCILRPDKSILISGGTNRAAGSPIVVARPRVSFLDPWPKGYSRLRTSGWQFIEANLVEADRRKYFDASVKGSTSADNVASIELTTSVSGNYGTRSYVVDVVRIASGLSAYPLEFALDAFSANYEFAVSRDDLMVWPDLPSRVSSRHEIELSSTGGVLSLFLGSQDFYPSRVTKVADDGQVIFAPDVLLSVLRMLISLPLTDGDVAFGADTVGGMHIRFATEAADYELYIPAIMERSSQPYPRDLRPITVA